MPRDWRTCASKPARVDLFEVLDAQRAQLLAEDALADARTRSTVSVVALYRTMAGGWPGRMPLREKIAKE
jgi:outer membrane protein TolC